MDDRVFDAFVRRAAMGLDRRSLLGLISGATLAAGTLTRDARAGKDPHGGNGGGNGGGGGNGKKDKKDKNDKKCRKQATACLAAVAAYCTTHYGYDITLDNLCRLDHHRCCGMYRDCKQAKADRCIREVPY